MGRWRKGIIIQTHKKLKSGKSLNTKREENIGIRNKQTRGEIKIPVTEQAVDFMKNMNPQQLVDFLLPDDWHVKTTSGN